MNTFYKVTSRFYDDGTVKTNISPVRGFSKPDNVYQSLNECDYYADFFDTQDEAELFEKDVKMY